MKHISDEIGYFERKSTADYVFALGITRFFGCAACSANAEITAPSADSDWLIAVPSLSRVPVAPVASARSEPARSTKCSLARVRASSSKTYNVKTA